MNKLRCDLSAMPFDARRETKFEDYLCFIRRTQTTPLCCFCVAFVPSRASVGRLMFDVFAGSGKPSSVHFATIRWTTFDRCIELSGPLGCNTVLIRTAGSALHRVVVLLDSLRQFAI